MTKCFGLILFLTLFSCAQQETNEHPSGLTVVEIHPDRNTALTRQNALHLAQVYDLEPFLYTKNIHIQSNVIPHSHPVLTLDTRHAEFPHRLLSTWLHEEFHWWAVLNAAKMREAIKEIKVQYPDLPQSDYIHLIICYLEYKALVHYLGPAEGKSILSNHIESKLYSWVYSEVLQREGDLKTLLAKHGLIPSPLL